MSVFVDSVSFGIGFSWMQLDPLNISVISSMPGRRHQEVAGEENWKTLQCPAGIICRIKN